MMNVALIHIGYFIALVFLSFISFSLIFGAGFGSEITIFVLIIPFVFSVLWNYIYLRHILSMSPTKTESRHSTKNWTFISLLLSGIFIVYSLLLTTLLLPVGFILSVILLLVWYALLFAYTKSKSSLPQSIYGSILFIISLILAYQIFNYLMTL